MTKPLFFALMIGAALLGVQAPALPAEKGYSADVLYNLGNSYARAGKPGLAALNYERAALLAPNDPDIEANLNYVRALSKLPPLQTTRFARLVQFAGPSASAWIGVAGVLIAGFVLLAAKMSLRYRWGQALAALLGVTMIGVPVCNALLQRQRLSEAVVIVKSAPVRATPALMGDALFELPEAEMVGMLAVHEDFILVRTRAGVGGWVSNADLAAVVPRPN